MDEIAGELFADLDSTMRECLAEADSRLGDERESEPDDLLDADYLDGVTPQLDDLDILLGPD